VDISISALLQLCNVTVFVTATVIVTVTVTVIDTVGL